MDNPHVLNVELAYLAGLVDGEGTITLDRNGNRRLSGVTGLQAVVLVTNTNEAIIQRTINIIKAIGVNPFVKAQEAGKYKRNKRIYWVTVSGLVKTAKVLNAIKPYLVGKIGQAQLLLDFIAHRGDARLAKGKPYGEFEMNILAKLRALNMRGPSETEDHKHRSLRISEMLNDSPTLSES